MDGKPMNEYDTVKKYNAQINKLIGLHHDGRLPKTMEVPRERLKLLRSVRQYLDDVDCLMTVTVIIHGMLGQNPEATYMDRQNLRKVFASMKAQKRLAFSLRQILKKYEIPEKYMPSIRYQCRTLLQRTEYLKRHIIPVYAEWTAMKPYMDDIAATGADPYETIHWQVYDGTTAHDLQSMQTRKDGYVGMLLALYEWYDCSSPLAAVHRNDRRISEIARGERAERRMADRLRRNEMAQRTLEQAKDSFLKDYGDAPYSLNERNMPKFPLLLRMREKVSEREERTGMRQKVILVMTYRTRSANGMRYYTGNPGEPLSKSPRNAAIMGERDPIPEKLKEMEENREICFTEAILE